MPALIQPATESVHEEAGGNIYTAGTLRYNRAGLAVLFGWLLWGDFAFTFFEAIFSRFMPLYLKDLHASNTLIGVMTGSLAGLVNVFLLPGISLWSDRCRSRFGRRIPFLLVVSPVTVTALVLVGFAPEIGAWLHRCCIAPWELPVSSQTVVLTVLCLCVVIYHLFNMVLVNVFNWLLRDVVPQRVMARFLSSFRVVGTGATFAFLWVVFPHILDFRKAVCAGIGAFYLVAFMLMCLRVKEGAYAVPPVRAKGSWTFLKSFGGYFRDCLALPIYRYFFVVYVLVVAATISATPFLTLFARESLHLSMEDVGRIFAWGALASALVFFPMGWLCDRFSAMRVTFVSLIGCAIASLIAFFLVHDRTDWLVYSILAIVPTVGWNLGSMAVSMSLFPKAEFGQFSAGLNVFGYGGIILGNYLVGRYLDWTGSDYRLVFVWSTVFFGLALVPMAAVYRLWIWHGGPDHYVAPLPR